MMKKKYILAFMFLLMLCGQESFGQVWGGDADHDAYYDADTPMPSNVIDYWEDSDGHRFFLYLNDDGDPRIKEAYINDDGELEFILHKYDDDQPDPESDEPPTPPEDDYTDLGDCNDPMSSAYPCDDSGGTPDPETCTKTCEKGYKLNEDTCECVKEPCTTVCESGYKLNSNTCECEELPPCWSTIKDYETSNAFNSNTILNKLNSVLGDFGISTDIMDSIKQMNIFDPKTIAAGTDFLKFADDLGTVGDVGQISMDFLKYMDEPNTQNLLKTVLDTAAIALSPAASLALSTIDYFKDSNGDSKLDLLLKAASDAIDRSIDCNLGLGIRNSIF